MALWSNIGMYGKPNITVRANSLGLFMLVDGEFSKITDGDYYYLYNPRSTIAKQELLHRNPSRFVVRKCLYQAQTV